MSRVAWWRPTLGARITIALVAVAVGVAAVTTGTLVWNARVIILESKQEAVYEVFRVEAKNALEAISDSPNEQELQFAAERFSEPTVLLNMESGASAGTFPLDLVPEYLLDQLAIGPEQTAYERGNRFGGLQFLVGLSKRAGSEREGDDIAVFSVYNMQDQQKEIDDLVGLGALLGALFVAAAAGVGLIVGRQLGRPLQALVEVAGGLGHRQRPPVEDTVYPDVNAVLDAMRHSADELDATIEQLEQSEATARRLVADVAHELRTPLATIVAVSDILADTESATVEERRAAGQIAARSGAHLTSLTNDILEMSRFDSGRSEVEMQLVNLKQLWRELAELRQWEGVDFALFGSPMVRTDALRIKLILTNLVTNALRHGEPPVEVRLLVEGARLTIAVGDDGPGVPAEHAPHLFERFYKASAARASSESSGLGLAIVRENARVLGGDAWLELEGGTVFMVRIPLLTPEPTDSPGARGAPAAPDAVPLDPPA